MSTSFGQGLRRDGFHVWPRAAQRSLLPQHTTLMVPACAAGSPLPNLRAGHVWSSSRRGDTAVKQRRVWPYLSPGLVPAGVSRKNFSAENIPFSTTRSFPLHPAHGFLLPHSQEMLSYMVTPKGHVLQPDPGLSTASRWVPAEC